jgi:hypothetical protein
VILGAALRLKSEPKHIKMTFGVISGVFCILIGLTILATARTYRVENFAISDAAAKCNISEHKKSTNIIIKGQEFVATKGSIIQLEANSPEEEVCEIVGQKRVYETAAPAWLYHTFFLTDPVTSVEYVVTTVYISKAK